jgi:hypothetical protein
LITHEEVLTRLLRLPRGEVQRVYGIVVRRPDPWTWEVAGEPARLLLATIDRLMALSGDEPRGGAA